MEGAIEHPERAPSPTLSPSQNPRSDHKESLPALGTRNATNDEISLLSYAKKGSFFKLKTALSRTTIDAQTAGKLLHTAVENDHFNIVRYILERHKYVINYQDTDKQTPLIRAAAKGSLAVVNHLIVFGAQINAQSSSGNTALHEAAQYGRIEAMLLLLNNKREEINIDTHNERGETPLFLATKNAQLGAYTLLREKHAKTNTLNNKGRTLLHAAVLSCYIPILLRVLKTTECDLNATDNKGDTPLTLAQKLEDQQMIAIAEKEQKNRTPKNKYSLQ